MRHKLFKNRSFYTAMLSIALPIALQNLISSSLNMVDTIMIGQLGKTEIAAVGLANQYFFLFTLLLFGTNSGLSIFISQFWGKEDIKNIRRVLGISIISGGIISILFTIGGFFLPEFIMGIFSADPEVIDTGVKYLRIVSLSYTITAISFSFSFASRSVRQAFVPMIVSAISLGTNTLNYI
ncbi:MATE family efflux transporter [Fonticella tunisiensis]|uniref:Probable multidrug resistance protein NorM n=1 Tax=Fonticella tunisiensis TaxID=1096341 RepID=A0A4R7KBY0_9CLOT|nr:MATE family efflux transporter [Fonticella tunisiensis]TDT52058.1 MatE protein [Fonticella tunisiensis]